MIGLFPLLGVAALVAGVFFIRWYARAKKPMIAVTAGMLFFFAFAVFWRSCNPAPEHHPYMRSR
jgi:hypothetical protein